MGDHNRKSKIVYAYSAAAGANTWRNRTS